ncbi:PVC-type heme-binding CxxCH protein [Synoicihabitans lomoniglobus]|uniref:ThuA domain-containing protein n=1 Tax=Synoicihabitans lomoniglobus TaxID=2909285 RepID=A0AAE9ZU74_9BACT|nr:ThuA domain-containing protein [Opitutaceae bacterium LMO-M01]WED63119.1 ThuA domain-containing protein [Opitutaceae bacterium LMO-M01]
MNSTPFRKLFAGVLVLAISVFLLPSATRAAAAATADDGVIDLLFLGHGQREGKGYHLSHVFAPVFNRSLGAQKIRMRYVEDPAVLNAADLAQTDVLMIYANFRTMSPEQEKVLLDFVADGGGFVPVHSASACFGHSQLYVDLVGARFKSHGMEAFTAAIVPGQEHHPIMDGFPEFETTDETYVHADHNEANRTVLMTREAEPWTWTRTHGQGRVFYTAYGHDMQTWGQAAFHDLLIRGIRWAAGDAKAAANLALVKSLPSARYQPADTIPNYRKQDPAPELAKPFTPEESQQLTLAERGFELQLFAAEPMVVNPIALAWDERGRLFVAETIDYPNEVDTNQQGDDRILILEDTDGDGQADKSTVFADGLNIPTSLTPIDGGWIVAQAPQFLFLKDSDGDDRADVRYAINQDWGVEDTHAGPSNLRYGFDNKIWGAVGYSDAKKSTQGEFGQGVFRMDPSSGVVEPVGMFSNNTWGLGMSEDFEIFGSTANGAPAWHAPLWRAFTYDRHDALPPQLASKIDDFTQFFAATDKFLQVDWHGRYTAGAGFNLYTARAFPERFWNKGAFIGGPTGHLLGEFFLKEEGSTYVGQNRGSVVASTDEWFSPVFAEVGPDGALWIADWYNFIIQHNPRPSEQSAGFEGRMGAGNAHENPLRDRQHGRIYRLVAKAAQPSRQLDLSAASTADLIAALSNDNMFWRMTAQRKLVREQRRDAIPRLREIVETDRSVDAIGISPRVIHALWSLHGLGAFNVMTAAGERAVERALSHPAASVRKNAVMALTEAGGEANLQRAASLLDDPDAKTRLKSLLALGLLPPSEDNARMLFARRTSLPSDPWLARAFAHAVLDNEAPYFAELLTNPTPAEQSVFALFAKVEEAPDYLVAKRQFALVEGDYAAALGDWKNLPASSLEPISLALLDAWKTKLHEPTPADTALVQQLVNRLDGDAQMRLRLRAGGLDLNYGNIDEVAYAAFLKENTFTPVISDRNWGGLGERVYLQNCVACHGSEARGDPSVGAPSLRGMENWYVQTQLQKFRHGLRGTHFKNANGIAMRSALEFLDTHPRAEFVISSLAFYLSSLDPVMPEPTVTGNAAAGQALYATCAACHGADGAGNRELSAPKLTGKQDWYLMHHLKLFHDGVRGADPRDVTGQQMAAMAKTVPNEQAMRDLAAYIQTLNTKN